MTIDEAEKIKTVVENKDYIVQLVNTVAKTMIEAFENLKIEDVNMFQLGYNKAVDDFDGSIIAVWKNAYVAEKHGYNRSMINQCCIGNKKSHRGYIWKYTNSMEKQIPKKPRNERSSVPLSRTSVRFVDWYKCGKCNFDLSKQFVCCPYCQSVIDWSDVD